MAVTENRVAGLQERLKEVMKCEQLNKQQFMKVTDISNIGRKLDGKVAVQNPHAIGTRRGESCFMTIIYLSNSFKSLVSSEIFFEISSHILSE